MGYYQFIFEPVDDEKKGILIAILNNNGFTGFEEEKRILKAFIPFDKFNEKALQQVVDITGIVPLRSTIQEQNWNAQWETGFKPVLVNHPETGLPFAYLRAGFHTPVHSAPYELLITPKMSFGTGHHPTTILMIEQMSLLDFREKSVLDFGTGTGILAILAEKLGASSIVAIDNDDWSIMNANENIIANNCKNIHVKKMDQPRIKADIILANINRNVLLENLSLIKASCNKGGKMLFSGLLKCDAKIMRSALDNENLVVLNYIQKADWVIFMANMDNNMDK